MAPVRVFFQRLHVLLRGNDVVLVELEELFRIDGDTADALVRLLIRAAELLAQRYELDARRGLDLRQQAERQRIADGHRACDVKTIRVRLRDRDFQCAVETLKQTEQEECARHLQQHEQGAGTFSKHSCKDQGNELHVLVSAFR
jgi:hypothetical protein